MEVTVLIKTKVKIRVLMEPTAIITQIKLAIPTPPVIKQDLKIRRITLS